MNEEIEEESDGKAKEITSFSQLGIKEELCKVCEAVGWTVPTKIQRESIPHSIQGRDVIGLAETGSGKTGAFALPILQVGSSDSSTREMRRFLQLILC